MNVYEEALRLWGIQAQIGMMMEEMGELIVALNRYDRGRIAASDVLEELVDVSIMIDQMRIYFDPSGSCWDLKRNDKLLRLADRVSQEDMQGAKKE